eukprot:Em0031g27a
MMTFVLQNGWSPFNAASDNGHLDVVKTLLEAGANINQATQYGRISLDLAVIQGHKATIQLLKTYPNKMRKLKEQTREQIKNSWKLSNITMLYNSKSDCKFNYERARRAEERATTAEKEHLETKQQRDAMQQQTRLQVQNADVRARRAEERATTAEKEHLETKQQRDAMQQQMRLQVQRADERARRAEERARTAEKEHLETKQQRDAMQQQIRLQVQQADERAVRAEQQIPDYMKSSLRVERDEIEETGEEPLGVGGWGEVRVAMFRGARVAAKFIHNAIISPHNINLFLREMHMAASVRHPNLLLFIGASLDDDNKPVILTELMPTNLRSIIVALPQDHVITIGIDVARGLNYLHLMRPDPIIHRDVSSANVLLEPIGPGNWKAKVSDYGSANFLSKVITMGPGNASYAAPESFNPKLQSPKMDVYSYGILLLEMATGQFPDHRLQAMQLDTLPWQEMAMMIRRCICDDPASRPTMKDLLPDLTDLDK